MRRPVFAALLVLAVAVLAAPAAFAGDDLGEPTATLIEPGYQPEFAPARSVAATLPSGVRLAGVDVGGLQSATAVELVRDSFSLPLTLIIGTRRVTIAPSALGAVVYAKTAVRRALDFVPGRTVDLPVSVPGAAVRELVDRLAKQYDRPATARRLALVKYRPTLSDGSPGRRLDREGAAAAIVHALATSSHLPVTLPVQVVPPPTPPLADAALIVVERTSNRLELYHGVTLIRSFGVATGRLGYPTPLGSFEIVVKQRNPWWYPPASTWAAGEKPVPPGAGNPLGTRWMGLSAPLVGIHGTPDAASIGYSRSHGCIRMRIEQAEWLFDHVDVGTRVMIVPA